MADIDKIIYSLENVPKGIKFNLNNGNVFLVIPVRNDDLLQHNVMDLYVISCDKEGKPIEVEWIEYDDFKNELPSLLNIVKDWKVI